MTGNVWFISGASNGFGRAIALEALRRGDKVVATSRNPAKMADLKEAGALVLALDVTADDATIQAVLRESIDAYGKITHCVNAAGYLFEAAAEEASSKEIFDHFNTNVFGTMNITRNILHHMRPQRQGVILNFGSLGSWCGSAAAGFYASTKWAVSGYTESLYEEAKPFGVSAVVVEPGYFRTAVLNLGGGNRLRAANPLTDEYRGTPVEANKNALEVIDNNQPGDVDKAAKIIVDVATRTGVAEGKEIPMRLVLGSDALDVIRNKCRSTEALLKEWESVIVSTDYDDVKK